ncbi:MAG: zinc transporter ZntB [Sphaerochaetaceae bacterium]|nr:zinc transporter ZntB [Sphaerochaetaceae bacterium]MDC7249474.1 zinc transporter ZntB [Sphaerochaetaceae bacterium]
MDNKIQALLIDSHGNHKELQFNSQNKIKPSENLLWIDLEYNYELNHKWLQQQSNVDPLVIEALLAEDTRPRYFTHNDGLLLILRAVNLNVGAAPDDMVSLRIWIEEKRIITIWRRKVKAISDLKNDIMNDNGPKTEGEFLAQLTKYISIRMDESINSILNQVEELEDKVFDNRDKPLRTVISELRRQIIKLRRYLSPQLNVISKLQTEGMHFLKKDEIAILRETLDILTRYVEDLDAAKERIAVTQDELDSQISSKMNKTMYLLSIVTVIFLPLSLITGLLGINVDGIPKAHHPLAFLFVCIFLILIAIIEIIFFKKKKWM